VYDRDVPRDVTADGELTTAAAAHVERTAQRRTAQHRELLALLQADGAEPRRGFAFEIDGRDAHASAIHGVGERE
jgi:hypothetical protein